MLFVADNFESNMNFFDVYVSPIQAEFPIMIVSASLFVPTYWMPAEVTAMKLTLKEGIIDVYHEFFRPKKFPDGLILNFFELS